MLMIGYKVILIIIQNDLLSITVNLVNSEVTNSKIIGKYMNYMKIRHVFSTVRRSQILYGRITYSTYCLFEENQKYGNPKAIFYLL